MTISKSAQEKMRQKQLKEIELLRKEREKAKEKEKSTKLQELQRMGHEGMLLLDGEKAVYKCSLKEEV